jgi:hypothetical protein
MPPPVVAGAALPDGPQSAPQFHPVNFPLPAEVNGIIPLQSLPEAEGVIYLDFDGESGPFEGWPQVARDAAPAGVNTLQIKEIWQRVAEDFQAFNLNITTDRRVFDNAGETSRIHVIITPTRDASPDSGGVALLQSFNWAGDTVCWAFGLSGKNAAEVISHEVGHTLGLSHDGRWNPLEEYYAGQGSGEIGWAPVMGVGYYQNITQWSRGEYASANNQEDDLSIIVNNNNTVDYRTDLTPNSYPSAQYLDILPDFTVSNEGIIETRSDEDAWRFQSNGGEASLMAKPVSSGPNLDIMAEILTSEGSLVASSNPGNALSATVTANLPAGDYILRVSGVGVGNPMGPGYSDYGSLGGYLISGSVSNGIRHDRFNLAENTPNGTPVGFVQPRKDHGTNAIAYTIASGNTGGAFVIDASSGMLSVANSAVLDYETLSKQWDDPANFELFITITDTHAPVLTETLRVVVTVTPVNESPTVNGGSVTLFSRTGPGIPVFRVTGGDPDRFDFARFSIESGNTDGAFAIDPATGQLTTAALFPNTVPGTHYLLTIRAADQGSPPLVAFGTVSFRIIEAPVGFSPGGLMRTYFDDINGATVISLTSNARYINYAPDSEERLTSFDAAGHGNNYGSLDRAWIWVPVSGNYTFWISADDAAELCISPDSGMFAAVRAIVSSSTHRYQFDLNASQQSIPLSLVAGQPYYLEVRHKQGLGDDHLEVAWQGPGISRQIISGAFLMPYGQNAPPRIKDQTFTARRGADAGSVVGTVVAKDPNEGDVPCSWTVTGGTAAGWCAIDAASGLLYVKDGAALEGAVPGYHSLNVRANDGAASPLTGTGVITLRLMNAGATAVDGIVQQIWTGISGNALSALTSDPRFPNNPTSSRMIEDFDTGWDTAENYGSRIRAMVTPPVSGNYNFYLASDNDGQLRFAAGANVSNAPVIASVSGSTARFGWNVSSSQRSPVYFLTAGQPYYLELRYKGGNTGNFAQVAWTGPNFGAPTIISGRYLKQWDTSSPPVWGSSVYNFQVRQGDGAGTRVGIVSATDPDNGSLVYSITGGNAGGAFAINSHTGAITVANQNAFTAGQTYNLSLRVQDNGANGLPYKSAAASAAISIQPGLQRLSPLGRTASVPPDQGIELALGGSGRMGATFAWSRIYGPGTVTFDDEAAYKTGAVFSAPGWYLIRGTETAGGVPISLDFSVQSGAVSALPGGDAIGGQATIPSHAWIGGNCRITAGGGGFQGVRLDKGYYVSQPSGSAVSITARVTGVQNISGNDSMAGLMIREGPAADARSFFCGITSQGGLRVIQRSTAGMVSVITASQNPPSTPVLPAWLRIIRNGNTVTSYAATDNAGMPGAYVPLGSPQTFPSGASFLIGLAAASGSAGTQGTYEFDNLTVSPGGANLAPSISILKPSRVLLNTGLVLDGGVTDDNLPTPSALWVAWTKWSGPGAVTFGSSSQEDTTAIFSAPGTYRLRLTADDGEVRSFREVTLNVTESPIEVWRTAKFGADASLASVAGDLADPDEDTLPNLLEYALNLNPLKADAPSLVAEAAEVSGNRYLRLTVVRNPQASDISGVIESSAVRDQPGSWTSAGTVVETNTPGTLSARTSQPLGSLRGQYLRYRVSR